MPQTATAASSQRRCVLVCQHRSCTRSGSAEVLAAFQAIALPDGVFVSGTTCQGQCGAGPTVRVLPDNTWYCQIKPSNVTAIVQQHLQANQPVSDLLHPRFHPHPDAFTAAAPRDESADKADC